MAHLITAKQSYDTRNYILVRYSLETELRQGLPRLCLAPKTCCSPRPQQCWETGERRGVVKKKKVCVVDGCTNEDKHKGQLCNTHYNKPCSIDGCPVRKARRHIRRWNEAVLRGGLPKKVCKGEGCTTLAQARGVCSKHGASEKPCSVAGCTTTPYRRKGLCKTRRRRRWICSFGPCTTAAKSGASGNKKVCTGEGCATLAHARGVCHKHSARQEGACKKHGGGWGALKCLAPGCTSKSQSSKGMCGKHGRRNCMVHSCPHILYSHSRCRQHSKASGTCKFEGCTAMPT